MIYYVDKPNTEMEGYAENVLIPPEIDIIRIDIDDTRRRSNPRFSVTPLILSLFVALGSLGLYFYTNNHEFFGNIFASADYPVTPALSESSLSGGVTPAPNEEDGSPSSSDGSFDEEAVDAMSYYEDESDEIPVDGYENGVQLGAPDNCRLDRLTVYEEVAKPLASGRVTSFYGYRTNPVTQKYAFHTGYDLGAKEGADIYAVLDGTVRLAGTDGGYGKRVIITHKKGIETLYAHCSKLLVKEGEKVKKGQKIALVGSTGNSTGPHLHIEFRKDGVRYDPEWVLGGVYN
ncbi:MAG: M23 family metallopeptidase [Oscillospiraceae bacterium]|nr:M23 family metallopeptidase [Oscillospiraceae bacterium]